MGRKYVLDGAILKCNKGLKPAPLLVITNQKIKIQGKFKATDIDFLVPQTFIRCKVKGTCTPALKKWKNTAKKASLKGSQKFLYDDSYTTCVVPGSKITIIDHLQINAAGAAFEEYGNISALIPGAMPLDGFEDGTTSENGSNSFLDGLQTTLDIAGLVPGFGEVADGINAAIYLGRGDYANAALSAAAMIPIGGQAATATKLGIKGTDAARTVAKNSDTISVLSRQGKTAREHAYEEMQSIVNRVDSGELGKRQVPKSLETAVNKNNGDVIVGRNGTLNRGNPKPELEQSTIERFKERQYEMWNEVNCSEADVVNQIHKKGDDVADYQFHAVERDPRTGVIQDKHTCRNCDVNMSDAIERGDVTSNNPASRARRDARNNRR